MLGLFILDIKANCYVTYRVVDRDMFMRFTGGGIGHLLTWVLTQVFEDEIQTLWRIAITEEHADENEDSNSDEDLNNLNQQNEFDPKDPYISEEQEMESENEGWYTDRESDEIENDLADDGDCIEDESTLGYEMF